MKLRNFTQEERKKGKYKRDKTVKSYIKCIAFGTIHVPSILGIRWVDGEEVTLTSTKIHKGLEMRSESNSVG